MSLLPPGILIKTALQYSRLHKARSLLLVLGIALGVSGVVAIDIAKTSVGNSFDLSTSLVTGKATHRIVAGNLALDQSLFTTLKVSAGIKKCAPVISRYTVVQELQDRPMQLLGIDPFSETDFRSLSIAGETGPDGQNPAQALITGPGVLISLDLARKNGLNKGENLTLGFGKKNITVTIAGFLNSTSAWERDALTGILIADIATAQELLSMGDTLSRIDLILTSSKEIARVKALLPRGTSLIATARNSRAVRNLSNAFETSLTAFSMLALFMGMFLIYNTVSFSVTQRRRLTGTLRSLGATRRDIFMMVSLEVLIYGIIGSLAGMIMGILMGKLAVHAVCRTVSDMYFVLTVNQTHIAGSTLVKGLFAGMISCVAATVFPALTASRIPPVTLSRRSASETRLKRIMPRVTLCGVLLTGLSIVIFHSSHTGPGLDFMGIFMLFAGSSLMVPLMTQWSVALLKRLPGPTTGLLSRMALNNIVRSLSRTSVLIASLMVVTSVYMGIGTMTSSFRLSVIHWIDGNIGGDIHLRAADKNTPSLDPAVVKTIKALPGVEKISAYAMHNALSEKTGEIHIFAYETDHSVKEWVWTAGPPESLDALPAKGWIHVSEIFAARHGIAPEKGARVSLTTQQGTKDFRVAGIFRDFFMGGGRMIVHPDTMKTFWGHDDITSMQLFLKKGESATDTIRTITSLTRPVQALEIRSGSTLKKSILSVFDSTFIITTALQFLTAIVALTGIINAVMALLLERTREMGILRACGAEAAQVRKLLMLECGYCGVIAGICALPFGIYLSWVLIDVINRRAFGWTYAVILQPGILLQAMAMALVAAWVAGLMPAVQAGKQDIPTALRME